MASIFNLTLDTTAPAGTSIAINAGAPFATARAATAIIVSPDPDTSQMKIWGDVDPAADANIQTTEGASSWITFNAAKAITLSTGDGVKNINCRVRDDVGNQTSILTDSITLDTTLPVVSISVAATPTKISKIATFDTTTFQFQADTHIQAWEVAVVGLGGAARGTGTVIPTTAGSANTTGGALAATTNQLVTIKGTDLQAASALDGDKIIKVFVQDDAGNWSA